MRTTLLVLGFVLLSEAAVAQPISLLPAGSPVRLSTRANDANPISAKTAHVIAARAELLEVRFEDQDSVSSFAWSDITRLEVPRSVPLNERVEAGAIVGGLVGAVAGAIAGSQRESQGWQIFDPKLEGAAVGAAYGILAGGAIGAVMPTKRWEQVWPLVAPRPTTAARRPTFFERPPTFVARVPAIAGRTPSFARP